MRAWVKRGMGQGWRVLRVNGAGRQGEWRWEERVVVSSSGDGRKL